MTKNNREAGLVRAGGRVRRGKRARLAPVRVTHAAGQNLDANFTAFRRRDLNGLGLEVATILPLNHGSACNNLTDGGHVGCARCKQNALMWCGDTGESACAAAFRFLQHNMT
jgi:hypothetical protein